MTGQDGGKPMLEALDRGNLFLIQLDDRRQWYRYQHLFGDVLRAHLLDEQPDRVHELHLRASDWYERNGDRSEAIRHALAAEALERAADLVELAIPAMRRSRQESTVPVSASERVSTRIGASTAGRSSTADPRSGPMAHEYPGRAGWATEARRGPPRSVWHLATAALGTLGSAPPPPESTR